MSSADHDIDAAILALQAVKLFANQQATSEQGFANIKSVADALWPSTSKGGNPLREGVATAIRKHFGPIT